MYKIQTKLFKPINSALYINVYTLWFGVIFFGGGGMFFLIFFFNFIFYLLFFLRFFSIQKMYFKRYIKKKYLISFINVIISILWPETTDFFFRMHEIETESIGNCKCEVTVSIPDINV